MCFTKGLKYIIMMNIDQEYCCSEGRVISLIWYMKKCGGKREKYLLLLLWLLAIIIHVTLSLLFFSQSKADMFWWFRVCVLFHSISYSSSLIGRTNMLWTHGVKMCEQEIKRGCGEEKTESQHMLFNIHGRKLLSRRNDFSKVNRYFQQITVGQFHRTVNGVYTTPTLTQTVNNSDSFIPG